MKVLEFNEAKVRWIYLHNLLFQGHLVIASLFWIAVLYCWVSVIEHLDILIHIQDERIFFGSLIMIPLVITYFYSRYQVNRANRCRRRVADALEVASDRIDYYLVTGFNGIAVNADSGDITVAHSNYKRLLEAHPLVFNASKILHSEAHEPGRTVYHHDGILGTSDTKNRAERNTQLLGTGLYLNLDDVMTPKVFVQMSYEDAEKWLLVIKKLCDETLDSQDTPLCYCK